MEQRPLWPGVGWGRERPLRQGSFLLSLLGADWYENLSEPLSHWLRMTPGRCFALLGYFFPFIFKLGAAWRRSGKI